MLWQHLGMIVAEVNKKAIVFIGIILTFAGGGIS